MHFLDDSLSFPDVYSSDRYGLLAIGGDLSPERLKLAYQSGIFPWYNEGDPILWWAPESRMVLFPNELKVSKSMRSLFRKQTFSISCNTAFDEVIEACSSIPRDGQDGTWINDEMIAAYKELHRQGIAKSVEVWKGESLVGGLYGIDLGHVFCGESMFSRVSNASKAAFIFLAEKLASEGYLLLDCQIHNDHLESLGAREIPKEMFMSVLKSAPSSRLHDR